MDLIYAVFAFFIPLVWGQSRNGAPLDCMVDKSAPFGPCSATCGFALRSRPFKIMRHARNGGVPCPASLVEIQECPLRACDGRVPTPRNAGRSEPARPDAVDCEVWFDDWTACSKTCDGGIRTRKGKIEVRPSNGGRACPDLFQTEICNKRPCGPTRPTYPVNCERKTNGPYPHPTEECSHLFYFCSNGETFEQKCPLNLYYHQGKKMCEQYNYVPKCGGNERPPPTPTNLTNIKPTPHPELNCRKLRNGNLPDPLNKCSQRYFSCANGMTSITICPGRLYYDAESESCQPWINVFACSNIRPTEPPVPTSTFFNTPEPVPIDCSNLKDGDYPDPEKECSERFFSCSGGVGSERWCAGPTFFDPELRFCDTFFYVPVCSGKPRPTRPIAKCDTKMIRLRISPPLVITVPGVVLDQALATAFGVSSEQILTVQMTSPTQMLVNVSGFEVSGFGSLSSSTILLANRQYKIVSMSIVKRNTNCIFPPKPDYPFNCEDKKNGNYAAGDCEGFFWSCTGGETEKQECPAVLKYDLEFDRCDKSEYLPKCGGVRPPVIVTTQAPVPPTPEFDCVRKPDGMYTVTPCDKRYFMCSNGNTYTFACPGKLYFDPDEKLCNLKAKIVPCKHKFGKTH